MHSMDLSLLIALDALLAEESVARAAQRMNLSAPAMSRTLGRIRAATGDPILVRAGRRLVPTPHALELRDRVREVVQEAKALLTPAGALSLETLTRTFTLRTEDGISASFAGRLAEAISGPAPNVSLRFAPQGEEDVDDFRDGRIDLEIGVIGATGPEIRLQTLFRDRFVMAVRCGHPLLAGPMTLERYAAARHVSSSRRGLMRGPIDAALAEHGLTRRVPLVVATSKAALMTAAASDLVAAVPEHCVVRARLRGMAVTALPLPVATPEVVVSQAWHPRFDADAAHRWLREQVRATVRKVPAAAPPEA